MCSSDLLAQQIITRGDIYIEHKELEDLRSQTKEKLPPAGTFWDSVGLTDSLRKIDVIREDDEVVKLKRRIHQRLIEELDLKRLDLEIITNPQ